MTTIAFDGTHICADGRSTIGNAIYTEDEPKIVKAGDYILAMAGDSESSEALILALQAGHELTDIEELPAYICGFLVHKGEVHTIHWDDEGKRIGSWKCHKHWAFGTGSEYAIAMMDSGKTAKEAVQYAGTRDTNTGRPYMLVDVKKGKITTLEG